MTGRAVLVGDRVRWTSSTTGAEHVGEVLAIHPDLPRPFLVRPEGRQYRWTAWEADVEYAEDLMAALEQSVKEARRG